MERYGYPEDAQRLAYRFLYMEVTAVYPKTYDENCRDRMTIAFVDFSSVVTEKFDAVTFLHFVDAD